MLVSHVQVCVAGPAEFKYGCVCLRARAFASMAYTQCQASLLGISQLPRNDRLFSRAFAVFLALVLMLVLVRDAGGHAGGVFVCFRTTPHTLHTQGKRPTRNAARGLREDRREGTD